MFAERLKSLRKSSGIRSQAELAECLGVTQQAVGLWERGKNMPDYDILKKLATMFNVSTDYLLCRDDIPPYYIDEETARIASEMKENPGRRVLFDASRRLSPESIKEVQNYIEFLYKRQDGSNDD